MIFGLCKDMILMNNKLIEVTSEFPIKVTINFAEGIWKSLVNVAIARDTNEETALSHVISQGELIETLKKDNIQLYKKIGDEYIPVSFT